MQKDVPARIVGAQKGASSRVSQELSRAPLAVIPQNKPLSAAERKSLVAAPSLFDNPPNQGVVTGLTPEGEIFEVLTFEGLLSNQQITKFLFSRLFEGIYLFEP